MAASPRSLPHLHLHCYPRSIPNIGLTSFRRDLFRGGRVCGFQSGFPCHHLLPDGQEDRSAPSPQKISALCSILGHRKWNSSVEDALREFGIGLYPALVADVLWLLPDAKQCLRFYVWALQQEGCRHNFRAKEAVFRFWGHEKLCRAFLLLLDDMQRRQSGVMSSSGLTILIKGYGWAGMVDKAVEAVLQYESSGFHLASYHLNCLLSVMIKEKNYEYFDSVFEEMKRRGTCLDAVTYSLQVLSLCHQGRIDEAREVQSAMSKQGIPLNSSQYNMLLDGLCKSGRPDDAIQLLHEMEERGCQTNVISYNTVINGLCNFRRWNEAFGLLHEMKSKDHAPNVRTFTTLMHGLCIAKEFAQAKNLLTSMADDGYSPNTVTYNVLIQGLCDDDLVEDACQILDKMVAAGVSRDTGTYKPFLTYWGRRKDVDKALEVLQEIKAFSVPCKTCYWIVLRGFCEQRRITEAEQIFEEMLTAGWVPNEKDFRAFCGCLLLAGKLEKLYKFEEDMMKRGYNLPGKRG